MLHPRFLRISIPLILCVSLRSASATLWSFIIHTVLIVLGTTNDSLDVVPSVVYSSNRLPLCPYISLPKRFSGCLRSSAGDNTESDSRAYFGAPGR